MHALVKECCISFNDLVAARFDSAHLDFWAAFTTPASKADGYARMIGASLPSLGTVLPSQNLNLPLPFFYTRDSGVALPTAALPYNEMRINFTFRDWREMLVAFYNSSSGSENINATCIPTNPTQRTYAPNASNTNVRGTGLQNNICNKLLNCCIIGNLTSSNIEDSFCNNLSGLAGIVPISDVNFAKEPTLGSNAVQVWANYAIVSNEERKRMACAPRDILIEQVQSIQNLSINQEYRFNVIGSGNGNNGNGVTASNANTQKQIVNADIRFSHAVKVLFFGVKNITNRGIHSNYTTGIPVLTSNNNSKMCVANCGLAKRYSTGNSGNNVSIDGPLYSTVNQYSCGNTIPDLENENTQYGIMTSQCCLQLDCCNAKDPLSRASLVYENTNRLGLMTTDYYSQVQPYYHAETIPNSSQMSSTWCQEGLHMYSYSLDFMCLDPLGSTNYGKLTNVQLNIETETNLGLCNIGDITLEGQANNTTTVAQFGQYNNGIFNMTHASMIETLFMTGNCKSSNIGINQNNRIGSDLSNAYCSLPYELVLTAVNNNIIRISGGALGFPVL
jgi:hypothetical protein